VLKDFTKPVPVEREVEIVKSALSDSDSRVSENAQSP